MGCNKLRCSNAGAWTSLSYPKLSKNGLFEKNTRFKANTRNSSRRVGDMEASPPASTCETMAPGKHQGIPGSFCLLCVRRSHRELYPIPTLYTWGGQVLTPLHCTPEAALQHPKTSPAPPPLSPPLCQPPLQISAQLCPPQPWPLHLHPTCNVPPNSPPPHSCRLLQCTPVSPPYCTTAAGSPCRS